MTGKATKRITVADMVAAAKLGTIDPTTEIVTVADATKAMHAAVAATEKPSGTEHECAIPGCKHGATHGAPTQPDRQVKLQCPSCGAVARMTAAAITKTGGKGIVCGGDGATFAPSTRRTYRTRAA